MSKKLTKPSGQEDLTSFWRRGRSKSFSNCTEINSEETSKTINKSTRDSTKKKRTLPSTEHPTTKRVLLESEAIPKLKMLDVEVGTEIEENQMQEDEEKRLNTQKQMEDDEKKARLKDEEELKGFSREFREFGLLMNQNEGTSKETK